MVFRPAGGERITGPARSAGDHMKGPDGATVSRFAREVNAFGTTPELRMSNRPPNNPWPAIKAQFDQQQDEGRIYENAYQDWRTHYPSSAPMIRVPPTPTAAPVGAPGGRPAQSLTTIPIDAAPGGLLEQPPGPLSQVPPNPIAMQPGLSAEQAAGRRRPSAKRKPLGSREAKMQRHHDQRLAAGMNNTPPL